MSFPRPGKVYFQDSSKNLIKQINVEIAETLEQFETGMMIRKENDEDIGMLFILEMESIEAFWMKDTFVNKGKQIEKIYKNAQSLDTTILPSVKPIKYVIEVNGGFTDKFNIKEGDYMDWERG